MNKRKVHATVRDVAKAAGVAVGSVSRALNQHPDVSVEIRERILAAAKSLKYARLRRRKAPAAAPIRNGSAHVAPRLGLICFGMEDALVHLPVMGAAMHGIESAVAAEGGTLMFASIPKGDRVPAFVADNQIAGVIVKGPNVGELPPVEQNELLRLIYRLPHVWLMGQPPNATGDHCNFDVELAGRLAAEHLRDKGHVHVAFLNSKPGHALFEHAKAAFCAATRSFGHTVDVLEPGPPERLKWPLPISSQDTVDVLIGRWAAQRKTARATAIAVGADTTAVQIYASLAKRGLSPGKDVGLVSCNNERALLMGLSPALTSIDVRADSIGRNAVARLLWRMAHPEEDVSVRILVTPVLVERESVPKI